jgi:phytoene desaturase
MAAPKAVVVGAGMGGLASAAVLAHRGFQVQVLELGPDPGGKAGREVVDGAAFDTGPSLLTMPDVVERLYALVGERAWDHVTLRKLSPAFRYLYPDGLQLDLHHELGATLDSVRSALGPKAAQELDFLFG